MKLSILICSLGERKEQLEKLLDKLLGQGKNAGIDIGFIIIETYKIGASNKSNWEPKDVEIIVQTDSGQQSIASKRNDLLCRAKGDYVCYIDDDDDVPDYYISEILKAISTSPDVVGIWGHFFINGIQKNNFYHSIKYDRWFEDANGYYRCPEHRNPVKRDIARKVGFNEAMRNYGEDQDYSMRLRSHLKTETYIDKPMYFYKLNTSLSRAKNIPQSSAVVRNVNSNKKADYDLYSTHQQALVYALMRTGGPVVEFGSGFYSTPLLHEICKAQGRNLVTFDNNSQWLAKFLSLREVDGSHDFQIVSDWDKLMADSVGGRLGVALIDQWPIEQRLIWIKKLLPVTDILVCHDADCKLHYPQGLEGIGKYQKVFNWQSPSTICISDFMELN